MSRIVNLKQYEVVFTTSFENTHGVSGHLYEMIDYFYLCSTHRLKVAILLSDGTTLQTFKTAILEKYNFSSIEFENIISHTVVCPTPKIIMTRKLCIVDGSPRLSSCVVYADSLYLLRCQASDFSYFYNHKSIKKTYLLQDFDLYSERYENNNITVIDYTKKILWSKYHQPASIKTNTALLYLTTNCRALTLDGVNKTIEKYNFSNYLIITNNVTEYASLMSTNVLVEQAPVKNVFDRFDTYIYTSIPGKFDCSPRFIVECEVFGKNVIYDTDYLDPGIECRKRAMSKGLHTLHLNNDDNFINIIQQ